MTAKAKKTVRQLQEDALRDPQTRRKVDKARKDFLKGLQLIARASKAVGPALQQVITGLECSNLMVVTPDAEYEFTINGVMDVDTWDAGNGCVGASLTLSSNDTEDGEEPYYVKAGFGCEADYFAAHHSEEQRP
jgi:hypothetical protein